MRGHIRKRGANSWELKYDVPRAEGGRHIVYRSFKGSRREAAAELARLLARVADGGHVDPHRLTVVEHVRNRVAQWRAKSIISVKTAERYEELVEYQLARFPIGSRPLQKLSAADVEAWHSELRTKGRLDGSGGLSSRTIGHAHKLLGKALREGVRHGLVLKNVASEERPPRVTAKKMEILSPDQVRELPTKLTGRPIYPAAVVALFTGLRRGELLALRWSDVNLDRKILSVQEALEETVEHGIRRKTTKTKSGQREIALPDIVVDTLREHRRQHLELRLALGLGKLSSDALVFSTPDGRPLTPNTFSSTWARTATELGLGVSFHALRHTHASMLIAAGVPITEIAHRLGHGSPSVTLNTYAHLYEKDDSRAANAINAALKG
jgi:integrase